MKDQMTSDDILKFLDSQGTVILKAISQIASGETYSKIDIPDGISRLSEIADGLNMLAEDINNRISDQQSRLQDLEEKLHQKESELESVRVKLSELENKDPNLEISDFLSSLDYLSPSPSQLGTQENGALDSVRAKTQKPAVMPLDQEGQATLTVPINISDQFIGMFGFEGEDLSGLSQEDLLAIEDIAEQVGLALENQRLFDQTQQALLESQILYRISTALNSAEKSEDILEAVVSTLTLLEEEISVVRLWISQRDNSGEFQISLSDSWERETGQSLGPREKTYNLSEFPNFEKILLDTKEPVYVSAVNENTFSSKPTEENLLPLGLKSTVMFPLIIGNRPLGVFTIGWYQTREFDNLDIQRFSAISAQMATSLDGLQLLDETKLRARQTQIALAETHTLYRISSLLNSAESSRDIILAIVETMHQEQFDIARLWLAQTLKNGDTWLEIINSWAKNEESDPFLNGGRFDLGNYPFLQELLLNTRETALISDLLEDSRTRHDENLLSTIAQPDLRGIAFLPLYIGNRLIGLCSIGWQETQPFTANDAQRYAAIGAQIATSVDSLRLLEETQLRAEQLEKLANVEGYLSAAIDENEIILSIAQEFPEARSALHFIHSDDDGSPVSFQTVASYENGDFLMPDYLHREMDISAFPAAEIWLKKPHEFTTIPNVFENDDLSDWTREFAKQMGYQSTTILPLRRGSVWEGVVTISWKDPHELSSTEAFLLDQLREPVSAIVTSRRSQAAEQRARQESELLYNASSALNQAEIDLRGFNQTILGFSTQFGIQDTVLMVYEKDNNENILGLKLVAKSDSIEEDSTSKSVPVGHMFGGAAFEQVLKFEDAYFVENLKETVGLTTGTKRLLEQCGLTQAGILMPLRVSQSDIGLLVFLRQKPTEFPESVRRLAMSLAPQIAVAVQNRLLINATQKRADRERMLRQLTEKVRDNTDVESVMQSAVTEIGRLLGRKTFLYLKDTGDDTGKNPS